MYRRFQPAVAPAAARSRGLRLLVIAALVAALPVAAAGDEEGEGRGLVRCANLTYARDKASVCFADHFLADAREETNIATDSRFTPVRADSAELFDHPFAVMSGEGAFTLTDEQAENLRRYLSGGGFLVASAGCSSHPWNSSFRREIAKVFPDHELERVPMDHPIFSTVHEIEEIKTKSRGQSAHLESLTVDGRIVLIYSPDGLNDTANAGGRCCCCGGNEILNARQINVNLLAYALTH